MTPEEREALVKLLKIILTEQQRETIELLKKILNELEKIEAHTDSLERMHRPS